MPTSKETRVRVDGFWKIIPSERPGRTRCSSRGASLIRAAVSSTSSSSSDDKSATRVKRRPFSVSGTSSTAWIVLLRLHDIMTLRFYHGHRVNSHQEVYPWQHWFVGSPSAS